MNDEITKSYEIVKHYDKYHLKLKLYYYGQKVAETDVGIIDDILEKVKLYEEEYNNLIAQNNIIKKIQNDFIKTQNLIDKTTNYYLKTLAKNGSMPDEAVEMFNILEGNK